MAGSRANWLTPRVLQWLAAFERGRVLHVFERSANLVDERGKVLSIVDPEIGPGPFNLVLSQPFEFQEKLRPDAAVEVAAVLRVGGLTVSWSGAKVWDPVPPWRSIAAEHLPGMIAALEAEMSVSPVRPAIGFDPPPDPADEGALAAYGRSLAGFGPGLTPSGDDVLMGLAHAFFVPFPAEQAAAFARVLAEGAAQRTTTLSAAWLRSAAAGEAGILWHQLIEAAAGGSEREIRRVVTRILQVGHTSGADAISGFLEGIRSLTRG